jgi:hypothetical protein
MKLTDLAMEWFKAAPQDSDSDLEDSPFSVNALPPGPDVVPPSAATDAKLKLYAVDSSDGADSTRDTEPLI